MKFIVKQRHKSEISKTCKTVFKIVSWDKILRFKNTFIIIIIKYFNY